MNLFMNKQYMPSLKNIVSGMALAFILLPAHGYVRPMRGDSARDVANLGGDCQRIGDDLAKIYDRYKNAYGQA